MSKFEAYYTHSYSGAVNLHYYDCKSLFHAQETLSRIMKLDKYEDYETALIYQYNAFGVHTHTHYFSIKDMEWHSTELSKKRLYVWRKAIKPIKYLAIFVLSAFGYSDEEHIHNLVNLYKNASKA